MDLILIENTKFPEDVVSHIMKFVDDSEYIVCSNCNQLDVYECSMNDIFIDTCQSCHMSYCNNCDYFIKTCLSCNKFFCNECLVWTIEYDTETSQCRICQTKDFKMLET